ncbi:MAG: IS5 family transposase, partial [Bacteroides sp.]|nr:IS5 family transposase [Bacteroides sp.]
KSSHHVDADRGLDDNKKIKGRKQHIVVDTHGFPIAIAIHQANIHDSKGAPMVIDSLAYKFPRLVKILADGGYRDSLADWLMEKYGWDLEVVLKPDQCPSKFQVLPKRWIVERSFAWLENYRRLTIDYEFLAETSLAMVQLAFYKIFLNKIID